jgi:hypothetical protein
MTINHQKLTWSFAIADLSPLRSAIGHVQIMPGVIAIVLIGEI